MLNYKDYKVRQTSEDVRQIHDEFLKREKLQKKNEQNCDPDERRCFNERLTICIYISFFNLSAK